MVGQHMMYVTTGTPILLPYYKASLKGSRLRQVSRIMQKNDVRVSCSLTSNTQVYLIKSSTGFMHSTHRNFVKRYHALFSIVRSLVLSVDLFFKRLSLVGNLYSAN